MNDLNREPEVIRMARELGLDWQRDPAIKVVEFCRERIARWLNEVDRGSFSSIELIERLVCAKLKLVIEEIHNEADMQSVVSKYLQKGEGAFANLRTEFDSKTFGVLMERHNAGPVARDRYVAVIDCRGDKVLRRFFSRWHEIAHLLTLYHQLALPFHRGKDDGSPLERLMDMIAGEVGFYGPILQPALESELSAAGRLTFGVIDNIQASFFPAASFQATLFACVNRCPRGAAYLEFGLGYKQAELKMLEKGKLSGLTRPTPKLRVLKCTSNAAARLAGILFHRNMEVPVSSPVFQRFYGAESNRISLENLTNWVHSNGSNLGNVDVFIETRRVRGVLMALVAPAREESSILEEANGLSGRVI